MEEPKGRSEEGAQAKQERELGLRLLDLLGDTKAHLNHLIISNSDAKDKQVNRVVRSLMRCVSRSQVLSLFENHTDDVFERFFAEKEDFSRSNWEQVERNQDFKEFLCASPLRHPLLLSSRIKVALLTVYPCRVAHRPPKPASQARRTRAPRPARRRFVAGRRRVQAGWVGCRAGAAGRGGAGGIGAGGGRWEGEGREGSGGGEGREYGWEGSGRERVDAELGGRMRLVWSLYHDAYQRASETGHAEVQQQLAEYLPFDIKRLYVPVFHRRLTRESRPPSRAPRRSLRPSTSNRTRSAARRPLARPSHTPSSRRGCAPRHAAKRGLLV